MATAYLSMSITESNVNIANNTSTVTVTLYYYGNGVSWNSGSPSGTIKIGGNSKSFSSSFTSSTSAQKLGSYSVTVTHNSSGGGSVSCSASFVTGTSLKTLSTSRTYTLSTIPRVSTLSFSDGKTSVTADGSDTIKVVSTKANSSFTDTLTVSLGSHSDTITSGTAFTIPTSWVDAIPDDTSAQATVTVTTKNGSTIVGTNTANFTVMVPDTVVPTGSITNSEANTSASSNFGVYVSGLSQLKVTIYTSEAYDSPIKSVSTIFDGATYNSTVGSTGSVSFTTSTISKSGTLSIVSTITDSRGRTTTLTDTVTVYPYSAPLILGTSIGQGEGSTILKIKGVISSVTVGSTNKNSKTLKVAYRTTGSTDFSNEETVSLSDWNFEVSKTFSLDSKLNTYDFRIVLSDKVNSTSLIVTTGKPVISRYGGGDGVTLFEEAVGKGFKVGNNQPSEFEGTATFDSDIYAEQDIKINDSTLEALWNSVFSGSNWTLKQFITEALNRFKNEIDYVVETGTEDTGDTEWKWEKWNSGKAIAWCTNSVGTTGNTTTLNSWYVRWVDYTFPTGLFIEAPTCTSSCQWGTGYSWSNCRTVTATTLRMQYFSNASSGTLRFSFFAVGRWK